LRQTPFNDVWESSHKKYGIVYKNECVEKCCQKERYVDINRDHIIGNV
jgi:hypothetical protein